MKSTKLQEVIQQERERVAQQLQELCQQNDQDAEQLKSLKQEYSKAVFDSDIVEMDKLNTQIKELTMVIQERKELIDVLSDKKNPVIQRAVFEATKVWMEQICECQPKC